MAIVHVTKENYDAVIASDKPVLLDFWAPWCGPCRMVGPIVEAIAEEYDSVVVGKVNVDEEKDLAAQYRVVSIPTLVVLEGGQVKETSIGYRPKADILEMLGL